MRMPHDDGVHVDDLEWFIALAETEHVTRAAEKLHITQPTLSRSLARLEQEVGAPLFDRVNRRLRLNQYGEVLLRHARRSVLELQVATEHIRSLRDPDRGTVRLGFIHSVATWLAPELIRGFRRPAPQVRFALTQGAAPGLTALLDDGAVDVIITGPRPAAPGLGWHPLHREQLCLVVPREHRLADRTGVDVTAVADEPFILLNPGFGLRGLADDLLARAGIVPTVAFEAAEIPTMESLAAAGLGVSIVPRPRPHRADPNAVYLPLTDDAAQRELGLAWPADRPESPVVTRFREFVRSGDWSQL